jgi:dTDP-4-amino-4,6-dideoxygalactose transaminase
VSAPRIGYGRQSIDESDIEAVVRALRSSHLTQGPAVRRFEAALEETTGAAFAVAVTNGTAALHAALAALGVGPGDRVLTSANTFLASATAAVMCGAEPEFVDVEPVTSNLDMAEVAARCERGGVRAVVAVHFAGRPCDMAALLALKRTHGFLLVEDACQALGATYAADGRRWRVGEHPEVDATALSFHPVKAVTTAEGGAVLCQDAEVVKRLHRFRDHGVDRASERAPFEGGTRSPWFAPMESLGWNYRLSDVQAALGESQLRRLPEFLARRGALAARYGELLEGTCVEPPPPSDGHSWHLYAVRARERRDALGAFLAQRGIGTQVHFYPVPLQPWFRERLAPREYPRAERHARSALSLPLYPDLTEGDQDRVAAAIAEFEAR